MGARTLMNTGGRRMTVQRSLLLEIMEKADGHLDALELYRMARKQDPRISLSTVYRTLLILKENGLIEELHLSEEHHHYEIKSTNEHYHVVCSQCGTVQEFTSRLTSQLRADLLEETGFKVAEMDIDISGLCTDCQVRSNLVRV